DSARRHHAVRGLAAALPDRGQSVCKPVSGSFMLGAVPQEYLKLLTQYDTPTICNVIELFEVRPRETGFMDGRIRACFPEMPPIAGYAATATMHRLSLASRARSTPHSTTR